MPSTTNKTLIGFMQRIKIKNVYTLDPAVFRQPEGMTFSNNGDLYISNEGGERSAAILKFTYKALNKVD